MKLGLRWGCIGFVEGVIKGVYEEVDYAHAMSNKEPPTPFCTPDSAENGQIIKIVLKYINDHPSAHMSTVFIIVKALREVFPCPVTPPAKKR